jgi:hypothetical protein
MFTSITTGFHITNSRFPKCERHGTLGRHGSLKAGWPSRPTGPTTSSREHFWYFGKMSSRKNWFKDFEIPKCPEKNWFQGLWNPKNKLLSNENTTDGQIVPQSSKAARAQAQLTCFEVEPRSMKPRAPSMAGRAKQTLNDDASQPSKRDVKSLCIPYVYMA